MVTAEQVWLALQQVIDPELGINVVDLGLVYDVNVEEGHVYITMTMTTPACPLGSYLTDMAEFTTWRHVAGARSVAVKLVWDPPWQPDMMSDSAKEQLGWLSPGFS